MPRLSKKNETGMELLYRSQWAAAVQYPVPTLPVRLQTVIPGDYRSMPEVSQ